MDNARRERSALGDADDLKASAECPTFPFSRGCRFDLLLSCPRLAGRDIAIQPNGRDCGKAVSFLVYIRSRESREMITNAFVKVDVSRREPGFRYVFDERESENIFVSGGAPCL